MIYAILLFFAFYIFLLLALIAGWHRAFSVPSVRPGAPSARQAISVVVPFRNEESSMAALIASLSVQTYPDFEVLLVDDASSDRSVAIAEAATEKDARFILVRAGGTGKKHALASGIALAKGNVIVTTDADCVVPERWLEVINDAFRSPDTTLAFGGVRVDARNTFLGELQKTEFFSVLGTGISCFSLGYPVYCNGASLAFRKSVYTSVNGYEGNMHIASGDDEFMLRKVATAFPGTLTFLRDEESVVSTTAAANVNDFLQQRLRWASKWKHNDGAMPRLLASFIAIFQLAVLAAWSLLFSPEYSRTAVFLLLTKFVLEYVFILNVSQFLGQRLKVLPFVVLQFLYPFYVLFIGLFSLFAGYSWKGRTVRV
jgi:poly-beta-1,6-N-acetyl-D-glucosamine synthase